MRLTSLRYLSLALWLTLPSGGAPTENRDRRLLEAVKKSDVETARALLNEKADVNSPDGDGANPLAWAVYHDDEGLVDLLIAAGATVNTANDLGVTPLALASTNLNARIVEKLLKHGANPNANHVRPSPFVLKKSVTSLIFGCLPSRTLSVTKLAGGHDSGPREGDQGDEFTRCGAQAHEGFDIDARHRRRRDRGGDAYAGGARRIAFPIGGCVSR